VYRIYFHVKFHIPCSSISLVFVIEVNAKFKFCEADILFHILQKYYVKKSCLFSKAVLSFHYLHTSDTKIDYGKTIDTKESVQVSEIGLYFIVTCIHNHPATQAIKLGCVKLSFSVNFGRSRREASALLWAHYYWRTPEGVFSATHNTAVHNGKHTYKADQACECFVDIHSSVLCQGSTCRTNFWDGSQLYGYAIDKGKRHKENYRKALLTQVRQSRMMDDINDEWGGITVVHHWFAELRKITERLIKDKLYLRVCWGGRSSSHQIYEH
jgi:hypothetical protein